MSRISVCVHGERVWLNTDQHAEEALLFYIFEVSGGKGLEERLF